MPFDFHNKDRIGHLIGELEELRYKKTKDIENLFFWEDDKEVGSRKPTGEAVSVGLGFSWSGWDRYNWLTGRANIPKEWEKEEVVGLFDFKVPCGHGNNEDFESLLYVNGKPYQGVDANHKEVFLEPMKNGLSLDLQLRLWSGLSGGGIPRDKTMTIQRAQIAVLDHATDDLYFLSKAVLESYEILSPENEYREWLLSTLVKAFSMLDFTEEKSDAFYETAKEAYAYLSAQMQGQGKPDVCVNLIGHTHIDVAWLWRLRHTREKCARSFSTVNRLMEKYPDYIFLQTQAQLYDYIKSDYPDIYDHIKARVKEGRWEPSGAMWVECDCNLASGESIIRQILLGKNFFKKEFDYESDYLWLPDVFGYSWALPQILKKSGVNTFMTTKISWNDTNRLPYDTFLWRGIDGTEITAHFITTTDPDEDFYTYNGNTSPAAIKGSWEHYRNKDSNKDLLLSFGFGDGGGGPTRAQLKQAQMAEKIPGIPHVKMEKPSAYFQRLNKTLKENPMNGYLPVWDGELYLEFHRGTYTSQGYNKKTNRRMEYLLRRAEMESVFAAKTADVAYDRESLLQAWKIVLCHQFHDILPGSSIKEVYEDSHVEYAKVQEYLAQLARKTQKALYKEKENAYTVFNSSNWKLSSKVLIPLKEEERKRYASCVLKDEKGRLLPFVWKEQGAEVWVEDMEAFSYKTLYLSEEKGQEYNEKKSHGNCIESPFYSICWNEGGQLSRIYDKEAKRELLPKGKCANVLQIFEDKPRCFEAWELEPTLDLKKEELSVCEKITCTENPLGWELSVLRNYHNSSICQTMYVYRYKRRIDFKTRVDWHERQKLLKAAFPVDVRAVEARFDIQNGNIKRPITRNTSWEAAKFEVAAHKWVDLSETGYGMALLNDCKYGYDVKEDTIRLSLLRSPLHPDYAADQGVHEFTYAILPHLEEWYEADIEKEAFDLNNPLLAVKGQNTWNKGSYFTFSKDNLFVDALKKAEEGEEIILRFHEYKGQRGSIKIKSSLPIDSWCECDLMEVGEEYKKEDIEVFLLPYEIKSLKLRIK